MPSQFDTAVYGDGIITFPAPCSGKGHNMAGQNVDQDQDFFRARLYADRDRHSTNATTFEKVLEMQYAQSMQFRDANAARIVMEAGSGRTRAETNNPGNTAAPGGT
jgi:hypothetical protein